MIDSEGSSRPNAERRDGTKSFVPYLHAARVSPNISTTRPSFADAPSHPILSLPARMAQFAFEARARDSAIERIA
jgi:hypothetical protein